MRNLIALALLLLAGPALADATPGSVVLGAGCIRYTMCSAEADTTAACDDGSSNLVANITGKHQLGFDASTSTATTFTCMPYLGGAYHATKRNALLAADLSETAPIAAASGTFTRIWVECDTAITGGTVTITMDACP